MKMKPNEKLFIYYLLIKYIEINTFDNTENEIII